MPLVIWCLRAIYSPHTRVVFTESRLASLRSSWGLHPSRYRRAFGTRCSLSPSVFCSPDLASRLREANALQLSSPFMIHHDPNLRGGLQARRSSAFQHTLKGLVSRRACIPCLPRRPFRESEPEGSLVQAFITFFGQYWPIKAPGSI